MKETFLRYVAKNVCKVTIYYCFLHSESDHYFNANANEANYKILI